MMDMRADGSRPNKAVELIIQLSIDRVSQLFSKFIKVGAKISLEKAYVTDLSEATARINAEDVQNEVIGSIVDVTGDAPFKFLFYAGAPTCLILTDLILQRKVGTSTEFDIYVHSAMQEIGNILASGVCSVFAADFNIRIKPTPPKVAHDFLGTIFQEFVMETAAESDQVLIVESRFNVVRHNLRCNMFILPSPGTEGVINNFFLDQI